MLWNYLHHLVREAKESSTPGDPNYFMLPDQFCNLTWREFMSWRLEDSQAPYLAMDTKEVPSKTPGMNPTRMHTNFLPSRKVSREKCHSTQFSKMRSILNLLKATFWSQPQPMAERKSWMEITNMKIMMIVTNNLNRRNISCTVFSARYSEVTWVKQ